MKIAIAGYGIEGQANYAYWAKQPLSEITIVDESEQPKFVVPEGVATILGPGAFEKLDGFDVVVRTAGLSPFKIKTDGQIWSATNEFFARCPAPIIGVTGTKGKGTTSSLIAAIFEAVGKKVHLVGNIGIPALDILQDIQPTDVIVFEMSSFQLWDIKKSPQTAVVLGIEPDHLNVHVDMNDYVEAKANIRRFQGADDICVYHPTNKYSEHIAHNNDQGKTIRYATSEDGGVYANIRDFYIGEQVICSLDALQLLGEHNVENACAAITVAKNWGIDDASIEKGLRAFQGLPHRIEYVRDLDEVKYYNDSFSSAPAASVAAIKSFDAPEILILGGIDKGADFTELIEVITERKNIKHIVVIGEIRAKLGQLLATTGKAVTVFDGTTMQQIVDFSRSHAQSGDVVILSPGCASFDMFKDFYDRGNQFRTYVNSL